MLVYCHLAKILCASNILKHITIHHFLLLDWNIMQCCESAHRFVWDLEWCIGWSHKGWPRRWIKHINHPFHIYSVLEEPAIHPDLAFCKYLLCNPKILKGKCKMFDGPAQYEWFNNVQHDIFCLPEHSSTFVDLGINPTSFGTHSILKGAITHFACGVILSRPITSICVSVNWKIPGVMNCTVGVNQQGISMLIDAGVAAVVWGRICKEHFIFWLLWMLWRQVRGTASLSWWVDQSLHAIWW